MQGITTLNIAIEDSAELLLRHASSSPNCEVGQVVFGPPLPNPISGAPGLVLQLLNWKNCLAGDGGGISGPNPSDTRGRAACPSG